MNESIKPVQGSQNLNTRSDRNSGLLAAVKWLHRLDRYESSADLMRIASSGQGSPRFYEALFDVSSDIKRFDTALRALVSYATLQEDPSFNPEFLEVSVSALQQGASEGISPLHRRHDQDLKHDLGLGDGDVLVGVIAPFGSDEGLGVLFDACAHLVQSGETLKLLLVGDQMTRLSEEMESALADKAPWLVYVGDVSVDKVADYYALLDVVVIPGRALPGKTRASSLLAAEALAYGKRLIVPDVAPLTICAQQYNGVGRFDDGSAASVAAAIQRAIKAPAPNPNTEWLFSHGAPRRQTDPEPPSDPVPKPVRAAVSKPLVGVQRIGAFSSPETVELEENAPIWHRIPVKPGQSLLIEGALEYHNTNGAIDRKAVLLLNCFDRDGQPLDVPCGKLSKSSVLKAYFKYMPHTQNRIRELHSFNVPDGVCEIQLGVCGFTLESDERVTMHELRMQPKPDKSQPTQFVAPSAQAAAISILDWPEQPPNGKPYMMGIMDEFTTGCFEHQVNLIQPRPDNWYALAEKYQPELFFIESAWKGNFGSWQYRVANYANKPGHEIAHICQYARDKGIPTLFWNKEDPVHHQKFMVSAQLVDHIFTTDANMKDSYREKTGNPNVHALPFAAQPALHKPAPLGGRKPRACFAGSWYGDRHAERGEAMRWLLQAANRSGLDIYDRNFGTGSFPFPEEYQASIKGSLPYKELCDEYSRYRVFLNVNSVTESPTMFSRRVFELMACGTPVVSTYAQGIENLFVSKAVWLVNSQAEADEALHTLMTDDREWRRRSLAGIREVFAKHTYAHRMNDIFENLGLETRIPVDPAVMLVAEASSRAEIETLLHFAQNQGYRNFQLGIACAQDLIETVGARPENVTLLQPGLAEQWVFAQRKETPLAGWISPHARYGEQYLRDLVNATLYEPEASGWAKALRDDRFGYGDQACLAGSVWKTTKFLDGLIEGRPEEYLIRSDLYVADSDQFQSTNLTRKGMGG